MKHTSFNIYSFSNGTFLIRLIRNKLSAIVINFLFVLFDDVVVSLIVVVVVVCIMLFDDVLDDDDDVFDVPVLLLLMLRLCIEDVIVSVDAEFFIFTLFELLSFNSTGATKLKPRNRSGPLALNGTPGESF